MRALEQRIGVEIAAVEERDMAGIDAALHRLQPVGLLEPFAREPPARRHGDEFPFGHRRLRLGRSHKGPENAAALDERIGPEPDLADQPGLLRFGRHVDALAGHVVFPAVIGTAQPTFLVASEPE